MEYRLAFEFPGSFLELSLLLFVEVKVGLVTFASCENGWQAHHRLS